MITEQLREKFLKERIIRILFVISMIFFALKIIIKLIITIMFFAFSPVNIYRMVDTFLFVSSTISFTAFIFLFIKNYKSTKISQPIVAIIFMLLSAVLMLILAFSIFLPWEFWLNHPKLDFEGTFYLGYDIVALFVTLFFLFSSLFLRKNKFKSTWKTSLFISTITLLVIVTFHIILSLIITISPIIDFDYGNIRIIVCIFYIAYLLVCLVALYGLSREVMIVLKEKSELDKILDISEIPKTEIDEPEILPLKIIEKIDIDNLNFLSPIIISALTLNIMNLFASLLIATFISRKHYFYQLWSISQIISIILLIITCSISFNLLYKKMDKERIKKLIIFGIAIIMAMTFTIITLVCNNSIGIHNTSYSEPNTLMKTKLFLSGIIIQIIILILAQAFFVSLMIEKKIKLDKIIYTIILTMLIAITIPLLIKGSLLFLRNNNTFLKYGKKMLLAGMMIAGLLSTIGFYFPFLRFIKILKQGQIQEKKAIKEVSYEKDDIKLLQEIDYEQNIKFAKSLIVSGMLIFLVRYIYQLAANLAIFCIPYFNDYLCGKLDNVIYYQQFITLIACLITGLGIREFTKVVQKPKQVKLLRVAFVFIFLILILKYIFGFIVFMIVNSMFSWESIANSYWTNKLLVISSLYTDLIPMIISLFCFGIVLRQLKEENLIEIKQQMTPILYVVLFVVFFIINTIDLMPNISFGDWNFQYPIIIYSAIGILVSLEYIIQFSIKIKRKIITKNE